MRKRRNNSLWFFVCVKIFDEITYLVPLSGERVQSICLVFTVSLKYSSDIVTAKSERYLVSLYWLPGRISASDLFWEKFWFWFGESVQFLTSYKLSMWVERFRRRLKVVVWRHKDHRCWRKAAIGLKFKEVIDCIFPKLKLPKMEHRGKGKFLWDNFDRKGCFEKVRFWSNFVHVK